MANISVQMELCLFRKIVSMFSPCKRQFLNFDKSEVICGPNDRALFGFATFFPVKWLVEDYGFTEIEAKAFVNLVHETVEGESTQ